jgi:hypothetical protein
VDRDDIIRMAREAGISKPWDQEPVKWETLERFANLVAAAEREVCAEVAEDTGNISGNMNKTWRNGCFDAAFAIRERGTGKKLLDEVLLERGNNGL